MRKYIRHATAALVLDISFFTFWQGFKKQQENKWLIPDQLAQPESRILRLHGSLAMQLYNPAGRTAWSWCTAQPNNDLTAKSQTYNFAISQASYHVSIVWLVAIFTMWIRKCILIFMQQNMDTVSQKRLANLTSVSQSAHWICHVELKLNIYLLILIILACRLWSFSFCYCRNKVVS